MHYQQIEGLLKAPYLYFIVADDHIYINTSAEIPFSSWAKEITEQSALAKSLQSRGSTIYSKEGIFIFCCRCIQIETKEEISRSRLLNTVGLLVVKRCHTGQVKFTKTYNIISPLENTTAKHTKPEEKEWLKNYSLEIFDSFTKATNSTRGKTICIMACQ